MVIDMRKIIVLSFISLDGVMQAPGGSEEDTSEGFKYGGWSFPFADEASGQLMGKQINDSYDLLLGRKTYDIFAGYWPKQDEATSPVAKAFNAVTKYVVSDDSSLELAWDKSELVTGDVTAKLKALKAEEGKDLQVHGSAKLIQTLLKEDLVDELWLKTYPVTLGPGKKLFAEGTIPAGWELTESTVTPKGVIFANYKRSGEVQTGSFA